MLNCEAFRMIKPVNCVDDYVSGDAIPKDVIKQKQDLLDFILDLVSSHILSIKDLAKLTSVSQTTLARRVRTQYNRGVLSRTKCKKSCKSKPVYLYFINKAA